MANLCAQPQRDQERLYRALLPDPEDQLLLIVPLLPLEEPDNHPLELCLLPFEEPNNHPLHPLDLPLLPLLKEPQPWDTSPCLPLLKKPQPWDDLLLLLLLDKLLPQPEFQPLSSSATHQPQKLQSVATSQ